MQGTHQDPVPHGTPIDATSFGPDGDDQCPCNEDDKRLCEVEDILGPAQVPTGWAWEPHFGHFDHVGLKKELQGRRNPGDVANR